MEVFDRLKFRASGYSLISLTVQTFRRLAVQKFERQNRGQTFSLYDRKFDRPFVHKGVVAWIQLGFAKVALCAWPDGKVTEKVQIQPGSSFPCY